MEHKDFKFQYSQTDGNGGILVARTDDNEKVEEMKAFVDEMMGKSVDQEMLKSASQGTTVAQTTVVGRVSASYCNEHNIEMKQRTGRDGKTFYSHAKKDGENWIYCSGHGFPNDLEKEVEEAFNK